MFHTDIKIVKKDNKEIKCYSREVSTNETTFVVEAGTTGNKEQNETGRNVLSYFSIRNLYHNFCTESKYNNTEMIIRGESEIRGIIKALKFIIKVLEEELNHIDD